MARKKKQEETKKATGDLSGAELAQKYKVTPEQTQACFDALPYRIQPRPEGVKQPKGKLWCCYCHDWKTFSKPKASAYERCETCKISTEDFWVKMHNGLWGMGEAKKKAKTTKRGSKK